MMPVTAGPRSALAVNQVIELILNASSVQVDHGAELLDINLGVLDTLNTEVSGDGYVQRESYATLHGSCSLLVSRQLDWGNAIVRPYITMTGITPTYGKTTARFNLGAYFMSAPYRVFGLTPLTYAVTGYDILQGMDDLVGDSFGVNAGDSYLDIVESIFQARGYTQYVIDRSSSAVLPASRVWPIDTQTSWLKICNDLLSSIGYQGVWSDWDGRLHAEQYVSPAQRAGEFLYDMGQYSIVEPKVTEQRDLFAAPNRWVAIQSNRSMQTAPVEGDGVYTYVNTSTGPSSVAARDRTITKVMNIDAADQASLQQAARVTIDADINDNVKLAVFTAPNPLHWHFDRMTFNHPGLGAALGVVGTSWKQYLDGRDMEHSWTVLS